MTKPKILVLGGKLLRNVLSLSVYVYKSKIDLSLMIRPEGNLIKSTINF